MRFPNATLCQGAYEPSGTFKASVSFFEGEEGGRRRKGRVEFLLKALQDSILGLYNYSFSWQFQIKGAEFFTCTQSMKADNLGDNGRWNQEEAESGSL